MNTDKLYIVIPAYNESANIKRTIDEWYPVVEAHNGSGESRLVIINDGSKDNTYEIMQEYAKDRPLFEPLTKKNGGHGPTLIYGYRYALKNHADFIFQTDSDGQTDPKEFEKFWEKREDYEAIFGNRTDRQDGQARVFVEKVLCLILRCYFGVKISDSNAPFRLMKADYVEEMLPKLPGEDYNLPNVMLTTFGAYYKKKIKFIPVSFKPRQGGKNSINIKKIIKIGWAALKDFNLMRKNLKSGK